MRKDQYPSISLVIVESGENLALITQTISSIIDNTDYPNYEFILVCDTDNNDVQHYLQQVPNSRIINNNIRKSCAVNRNNGSQLSSSDYLNFLDSDIIVRDPQWLRKMVDVYESDDAIGIVGGGSNTSGSLCWLHHSGLVSYSRFSLEYKKQFGKPFETMIVMGHNMLIKRRIFEAIQGFDEGFTPLFGDDSDICIKTVLSGYKIMDTYVDIEHVGSEGSFNNSIARFGAANKNLLHIAAERRIAFKYAAILPTRPLSYYEESLVYLQYLRSIGKDYLSSIPSYPPTTNIDGTINLQYLPLPAYNFDDEGQSVWNLPDSEVLKEMYKQSIFST